MSPPHRRATFLGSDRLLARVVARPVIRFLHIEAAGGILLLVATAVALVWANSPWKAAYHDVWATELAFSIGDFTVAEDARHWVNDGLMAVFFFVVGLEIKGEVLRGQLSSARDAALPAVAAIGGMVVPALLFLVLNSGGEGARGWGVPMATDIAFAVGVLALLGDRAPPSLKVLLLALAIVDDIGAILVIAVVYTDELSFGWAAVAVGGLVVFGGLRRVRVWYPPIYAVVGFVVWLAVLESGIHATIAGVALGLLTPGRPLMPQPDADRVASELSDDNDVDATEVRDIAFRIRESVSIGERLEEALHPWTSYVVIPLFALANAGLVLSADGFGDALGSDVTRGVVVGLVVGKVVGVLVATTLAVRLGIARLPDDVSWLHIVGMAALAGIGFTVSIFIGGLAFDDPALVDQAKLGVLVASVVAAVVGAAVLQAAARSSPDVEGSAP